MINGTNMLGKHNPRWPDGNVTETIRLPAVTRPRLSAPLLGRGLRISANPGGRAIRAVRTALSSRLSRPFLKAGTRLFVRNDAEANWQHWWITEFRGGLARSYRDPRFDALRSLHEVAEQLAVRVCATDPEDQDGPLP
jgi:hypothetical protein